MNWQQIARRLAPVAPAVGTALLGPAAGAVGAMLADKLGVAPTPAAVQRQIDADPDAMERIAEIEADLAKAAMADTQHARETLKGHWMTWALPLGFMVIIGAAMAALMVMPVPAANAARFDLILGFLLGAASAGVTFWLGSSRGSAERAAQIADMTKAR
ncbi:MAG: hypothetical protein KAX54_00265 [Thauera sp.]|nr:hypothetical protein [Thauera sp.]